MALLTGYDPVVFPVKGECVSQLHHRSICGAKGGNRTHVRGLQNPCFTIKLPRHKMVGRIGFEPIRAVKPLVLQTNVPLQLYRLPFWCRMRESNSNVSEVSSRKKQKQIMDEAFETKIVPIIKNKIGSRGRI